MAEHDKKHKLLMAMTFFPYLFLTINPVLHIITIKKIINAKNKNKKLKFYRIPMFPIPMTHIHYLPVQNERKPGELNQEN